MLTEFKGWLKGPSLSVRLTTFTIFDLLLAEYFSIFLFLSFSFFVGPFRWCVHTPKTGRQAGGKRRGLRLIETYHGRAVTMDRLAFVRAQAWFEEEEHPPAPAHGVDPHRLPPLRTLEHAFAAFEVFEGICTFRRFLSTAYTTDRMAASDDGEETPSGALVFRSSLLASSCETRIRLALRAAPEETSAPFGAAPPGATHGTNGGGSVLLAAGAKRPREGEAAGPEYRSCELLARFESAGRALQGRILHTHVVRMTENVTELQAEGGTSPTTPYVQLHFGKILALRVAPLPELSNAAGSEQLKRLVERMLSSLPKTTPSGETTNCLEVARTVEERTSRWHAFVRCARELSTELEGGLGDAGAGDAPEGVRRTAHTAFGSATSRYMDSAAEAARQQALRAPPLGTRRTANSHGAACGGTARALELLSALPLHLSHAMPRTAHAEAEIATATKVEEDEAEAAYVERAMLLLQGGSPPGQNGGREGGAATAASPENATEGTRRAREAMQRAYAAKLGALLLPGRAGS